MKENDYKKATYEITSYQRGFRKKLKSFIKN